LWRHRSVVSKTPRGFRAGDWSICGSSVIRQLWPIDIPAPKHRASGSSRRAAGVSTGIQNDLLTVDLETAWAYVATHRDHIPSAIGHIIRRHVQNREGGTFVGGFYEELALRSPNKLVSTLLNDANYVCFSKVSESFGLKFRVVSTHTVLGLDHSSGVTRPVFQVWGFIQLFPSPFVVTVFPAGQKHSNHKSITVAGPYIPKL